MGKKNKKREEINVEDYDRLLEAVSLGSIHLSRLSSEVSGTPKTLALTFSTESKEWRIEDSVLYCEIVFKVQSDPDKRFLLNIEGKYLISYLIHSQEPIKEEAIEYYATQNAPYHAYPYFRELVDNMTWRMGLKPIQLPILLPSQITKGAVSKTKKDSGQ